MKWLLFLFSLSFSLDLNDQLNQMEQQQQQGQLKGFIIQKKMELIPPDELFKEEKQLEPLSSELLQPIPQSNYVSYQTYHEDILQLSNKVATLEYALDRLSKITSGVQKSSINNSEFILKLIEILAAAIVGGGGLVGTLMAYKKKKNG